MKNACWWDFTRSPRGFAISRAEFTTGVTTLASPVFDLNGQVSHVLQCPGLEHRLLAPHFGDAVSGLLAGGLVWLVVSAVKRVRGAAATA